MMNESFRNYIICFMSITALFSLSNGTVVSKISNHFSLGEVGVYSKTRQAQGARTVHVDGRRVDFHDFAGDVRRIIVSDLNGRIIAAIAPRRNETQVRFPAALADGCYIVMLKTKCAVIMEAHVIVK